MPDQKKNIWWPSPFVFPLFCHACFPHSITCDKFYARDIDGRKTYEACPREPNAAWINTSGWVDDPNTVVTCRRRPNPKQKDQGIFSVANLGQQTKANSSPHLYQGPLILCCQTPTKHNQSLSSQWFFSFSDKKILLMHSLHWSKWIMSGSPSFIYWVCGEFYLICGSSCSVDCRSTKSNPNMAQIVELITSEWTQRTAPDQGKYTNELPSPVVNVLRKNIIYPQCVLNLYFHSVTP